MILPPFETLFLLIAAHALADYPLQGEFLARMKSPDAPKVNGETIWPLALFSHCAIHGALVMLLTGSVFLGAAETISHAIIDHAKCRGWISFKSDQVAHILCKVCWWLIALNC